MIRILRRPRVIACTSGVTAVEFALVLPPLLMMLIGLTSASLVAYSASSLHFAAEQAARCYSVNSDKCSTPSDTQTYAAGFYSGLNTPKFVASSQACGRQVTATVSIALNAALAQWDIPLSATACFP